jgi:hypothetical protein
VQGGIKGGKFDLCITSSLEETGSFFRRSPYIFFSILGGGIEPSYQRL